MKNQLLAIPNWYNIWRDHFSMDPSSFALRFSENKEWPVREIAEQIHCYPRAIAKLGPVHRPGMVYRREALEQSSGWAVAGWRAKTWVRLIQHERDIPKNTHDVLHCSNTSGKNDHLPLVADLTGGLGIDTAAFALEGAHVHCCERNSEILAIARHNHALLGCSNNIQYHNNDSFRWLRSWKTKQESIAKKELKPFNLVYIDPSRRKNGRRVISLEKSEPVITDHIDLIRSVANRYLVKLSPVLDLAEIERKLPDCKRIIAVSVDGEVKELLADCIPWSENTRNKARLTEDFDQRKSPLISSRRESVHTDEELEKMDCYLPVQDILHQKPELHAIILNQKGELSFHFSSKKDSYDSVTGNPTFEKVDSYVKQEFSRGKASTDVIFEPDPAIIKMGLVDKLSRAFGLRRVNRNTSYLCGGFIDGSFPGKGYRIIQEFPYKPRQLKKWLAQNECTRVQIHKRGFPLSVEQLYSKLGCVMGDDVHLIATENAQGNLVLFLAESL